MIFNNIYTIGDMKRRKPLSLSRGRWLAPKHEHRKYKSELNAQKINSLARPDTRRYTSPFVVRNIGSRSGTPAVAAGAKADGIALSRA